MSISPFPRIQTFGAPYQRGQQYGSQAASYVQLSLEAYQQIFVHYTGWAWEQVCQHAMLYLPAIGNFRAHLVDEMQGIADGAGVSLADIIAINVRTEILNAAFAKKATAECTSFYTTTEIDTDRHIIIGENWDWKPATARAVVLLESSPDQGPNFMTIVEAGLLAKMGMNSAGIGLATNALSTNLDVGLPGVPYHIILRSILESSSFDEAASMVQTAGRASSANYMIANRDGKVLDLETGPGVGAENLFLQPVGPGYVHTNHFMCAQPPFTDVGLQQGPDSPIREERMKRLLLQGDSGRVLETIMAALGDHQNHPFGICAHPEESSPEAEQYATIASLIMDLTTRQAWLAGGNPCQAQYQHLDYGEFLAG
ncbi:MAG: C45 family autoproteolytic acyltransferase/hydrolase [Chloroflexi bacterium]|nr:C45 family autoproteolytic acyltransferase/hydrolase [Chloroflexota bacterium]